jgi:hypothetical protein
LVVAVISTLSWGVAGAVIGSLLLAGLSVAFITPFVSDASATYHALFFLAVGIGVVIGFSLGVVHGLARRRVLAR